MVNKPNTLSSSTNENALSLVESFDLIFNSDEYSGLKHMQGGEFSESGELLYLVSGSAGGCVPIPGEGCGLFDSKAGPGEPQPSDGIHVFKTSNWTEIRTSVNGNANDEPFIYSFDNDLTGQSPEGLTIWNLEDGSVNEFKGSLHVLIFDWDLGNLGGSNDHEVSMHHFSNKVHVDSETNFNLIGPLSGNAPFPFQNFNDAYEFYPIWDGAEIKFKAGEYNGPKNKGIYDKKIRLTSEGGPAIIGQQ